MTNELSQSLLAPAQLARIEAAEAARQLLRGHAVLGGAAPDLMDLVTLTTWILTGEDPWPIKTVIEVNHDAPQ